MVQITAEPIDPAVAYNMMNVSGQARFFSITP